jgi:hypothetical protein
MVMRAVLLSGAITFALSLPAPALAQTVWTVVGSVNGSMDGGLAGITVEVRTTAGVLVGTGVSQPGVPGCGDDGPCPGLFGVPVPGPGLYLVRTRAATNWVNEAFNNFVCIPDCAPTTGTPVLVDPAGPGTSYLVSIVLARGGSIGGHIAAAGSQTALAGVTVKVYAANGALAFEVVSDAGGNYVTPALPPGTYYARTANSLGFQDQIYPATPVCVPACQAVSGQPITVSEFVTTTGIDFTLAPKTDLIQNGDFSAGMANWGLFATPDITYIVSSVTAGVFQFYRVPPPPGTTNQALIQQQTGAALAAGVGVFAEFDFGNSSSVRKRITVLVHESDFGDLNTCTFWLPANSPRRRYALRAHTTRPWTNATISFYAASAGANGGSYEIDNVSLQTIPAAPVPRADCLDALAPGATPGADSAEWIVNGDFASGSVTPGWGLFGQIQSQVSGGVFEFIKLPGTPSGVVLQSTGQAAAANDVLTATFQLGNSSAMRQRATVILHDLDFSDLAACTFWLEPGQPLGTYTFRTFATRPWTNATLAVYPATPNGQPWIQLDNVSMRRTPSSVIAGTECTEPDAASAALTASRVVRQVNTGGSTSIFVSSSATTVTPPGVFIAFPEWRVLQVSQDGIEWETIIVVGLVLGEPWLILDAALSEYLEKWAYVRVIRF